MDILIISIIIFIIIIIAVIGIAIYYFLGSGSVTYDIWETFLTDVHKMTIIDPQDPTMLWKSIGKITLDTSKSDKLQALYVYQDDFTDDYIFSQIDLTPLPLDYKLIGVYFVSYLPDKSKTKYNVMRGIYGEKEVNWLALGEQIDTKFAFWAGYSN